MASDDLSAIPGLEEKHRRVLADLGVTSAESLAAADQKQIHGAMRRLRPRPTVDDIAAWQEHARRYGPSAVEAEWERAATFVVSFEQRRGAHGAERQLLVERTELEPEQPAKTWSGWDCRSICSWMLEQLDEAQPIADEQHEEPPAPRRRSKPRSPIRVELVTLVGGGVDIDLTHADPAAKPILSEAERLTVEVSGVDPDHGVNVAARLRRRGHPGMNLGEPIPVEGDGRVEFDLARLTSQPHHASVLVWTADGSSTPTVVRLPPLARSGAVPDAPD
jgi:hypothetical protein